MTLNGEQASPVGLLIKEDNVKGKEQKFDGKAEVVRANEARGDKIWARK